MTDLSGDPTFHWEDFHNAGGFPLEHRPTTCDHNEVKAHADGNFDNSWAFCTFCDNDLTDSWWEKNLRDDYALVSTLGTVQLFTRRNQ